MSTIKFVIAVSIILVSAFTNMAYGQTRTFEYCYLSWLRLGDIIIQTYPIEIDRDIKQFFAHYCNDIHDTYGIWVNALDQSEIMQYPQYSEKFGAKYYYPAGIPDSVMNLFHVLQKFWEIK